MQRQSNNFCPKFTDEECIATYLWGIYNQKFNAKDCYRFIKDFYKNWFPNLPSYQAYNKRICYLADAFKGLADISLNNIGLDNSHSDFLIDSMPIILANSKRCNKAKIAPNLCSKGYCASKGIYYYGIKLHTLAQCNFKAMSTPASVMISKASEHDLTIGKEILEGITNIRVFGDMAFSSEEWQTRMFFENNVEIITPIKRTKNKKKLSFWEKTFSQAVSGIKQAIESLNNWLIEKTNIQRASKVRSEAGLISFVFARVACVCLCFKC